MARPFGTGGMTIAQLESMLNSRRGKVDQLMRERRKIQSKLDGIDRQIASLAGRGGGGANGSAGGPGSRVRNAVSLVATLVKVMKDGGKPMGVGDITDAVKKTGYRSNSANFRAIVNQTLIKERKHFAPTGRGVYQIKK
jgi:hypothetical protein